MSIQECLPTQDEVMRDWARLVAPLDGIERKLRVADKINALQGIVDDPRAVCEEALAKVARELGVTLESDAPTTASQAPLRILTVPELVALPEARVDWILKGYFARGMLTQITGGPKDGKTTFIGAAAAAVSEGREFIGLATTKTPVLYFTEEGKSTFTAMMRRVCAADAAGVHVLLRSETFGRSWSEVCAAMRQYRSEHDVGLVIVDTFTDLAGLPGEDENISGPVLEAIGHLRPIAADGASVVISRHDRKEGGSLVESGRGSGAFAGAMDVLMALRKKGEGQREILGIGRPEGVPDSLFVTFDGLEFSAADDPRHARDMVLERQLLEVLPHEESEAIGIDAVAAQLECSARTARKQLKRLRDEGAVQSARGKGTVSAPQAIGWWAP